MPLRLLLRSIEKKHTKVNCAIDEKRNEKRDRKQELKGKRVSTKKQQERPISFVRNL